MSKQRFATPRDPRRVGRWRELRWALGAALCAGVMSTAVAQGQRETRTASFEAVKKQVEKLRSAGGLAGLNVGNLLFILDPQLKDRRSLSYGTYPPDAKPGDQPPGKLPPGECRISLADLASLEEQKASDWQRLLEKAAEKRPLGAYEVVAGFMKDFFGLFASNPLVKKDLSDLLHDKSKGESTRVAVMVRVRFWARARRQDRGGKLKAHTLCSRVELRVFKVKTAEIPGDRVDSDKEFFMEHANLLACELVYMDAARGKAPLTRRTHAKAAMRAALADAFLDKLAVPFSVSRSLAALFKEPPAAQRTSLEGHSIGRSRT